MNNILDFIPLSIKEYVNGLSYNVDDIGTSQDNVIIFDKKFVLKISSNLNMLKREYDLFSFMVGKVPGPIPIVFVTENDRAYFLRSFVEGESLISNRIPSDIKELIKILVEAVGLLKNMDKYDCPYESLDSSGDDFVHGDLCLPNILIDNDNNVIGFVDVSAGGKGDRWFDYAWLLWSMEYNLKTKKYHHELLQALEIEFDEEKYNLYIPLEYRK